MLVVLPYCRKDADLLLANLEWMGQLGKQDCACFLVGEYPDMSLPLAAQAAFREVHEVMLNPYSGPAVWPGPQNHAFRETCRYFYENSASLNGSALDCWLWLEPDAVPLKKNWVDTLEREYQKGAKPFMGCVVHHDQNYMAGIAVYPWNALEYSPRGMLSRSVPFDFAMWPDIANHVHNTKLIDHRRNHGHMFKSISDLDIIHPEAVIFHKSKDGGAIEWLRKREKPFSSFRSFLRKPKTTGNRYYHSGNLGDIIYSLYAIKKNGGGTLLIGPQQDRTARCSNPISLEQFKLLKPLLDAQSYIQGCDYRPTYPTDASVDLNRFRDIFVSKELRTEQDSLCKAHFDLLGIADKFKEDEPWLKVTEPIKSDRIVIARSLRHRNWFFPWGEVCKRFGDKLLFIGLPKEHEVFELCWPRVEFRPCKDFLEMVSVIAGAKGFCGNQSAPMAMAIGLGVPVLQELWDASPDCVFDRKSFTTSLADFKP